MGRFRRIESELVAHIAEVDERRLYAREASPSMFAYCTDVLHLSEHEAYLRITVARASREHPMLLTLLSEGRLHLSGIAKLVPHLTPENRDRVLDRASHRSKREIEELVAELAPRMDAPASVRKLPQPEAPAPNRCLPVPPHTPPPATRDGRGEGPPLELGPDRVAAPPARSAVIEPLAPTRYKVQFTAGAELCEKLDRLQALMPGADIAQVIERAVTEKLARSEARRFATTESPRKALDEMASPSCPSSRHIPAAVRRAVHGRDEGRCTYVAERGQRCTARADVEFHHHGRPYGRGGEHSAENLRLMCRAHNTYLAERDYGKAVMARYRRGAGGVSEVPAVCWPG